MVDRSDEVLWKPFVLPLPPMHPLPVGPRLDLALAPELDLDDMDFFTRDKRRIQCKAHGALYEPTTGVCVEGPCKGRSLAPLRVECEGDDVFLLLVH